MSRIAGRKVFVGLSGGVDSSVSAALLKKAGYDVIGVFIRVWQPDFFECSWRDDRLDAMRVCATLGIPFHELNLEKEYKEEVVDYMIREYREGRTPNPDVMCNRFIKFGAFYKWARGEGADFIATGHYARIVRRKSHNAKQSGDRGEALHATRYTLHTGLDSKKDQSYFLWQIRKEQLPHILFPVGGMRKTRVRSLAKRFGLITADKRDSQGLCFLGKVDMKEFLSHYIKDKTGKVCDEKGNVLGNHTGAFFHTIGERIGNLALRPHSANASARKWFVVAKNLKKNTLTVSSKYVGKMLVSGTREISLKNCNWLVEPKSAKVYLARARYRGNLQKAKLVIRHSSFAFRFDSLQLVAAGQSLVLYEGDVLVGGGVIEAYK